jgi:hypothetical protein
VATRHRSSTPCDRAAFWIKTIAFTIGTNTNARGTIGRFVNASKRPNGNAGTVRERVTYLSRVTVT